MKLTNLILEAEYSTYAGMLQIIYNGESPSRIAELIRALPGVTTVALASHNDANNTMICRVKLITQKTGLEAFKALKYNALKRYKEVRVINIGTKSIELKKGASDKLKSDSNSNSKSDTGVQAKSGTSDSLNPGGNADAIRKQKRL